MLLLVSRFSCSNAIFYLKIDRCNEPKWKFTQLYPFKSFSWIWKIVTSFTTFPVVLKCIIIILFPELVSFISTKILKIAVDAPNLKHPVHDIFRATFQVC